MEVSGQLHAPQAQQNL